MNFVGRDAEPYDFSGHVSCLAVSGTEAVIGVMVDQSDGVVAPAVGQGVTLLAADNHAPVTGTLFDGAPPDADRFVDNLSSSGCPAFQAPFELYYVYNGDIAVHDAPPPPTTYAQCRQGSWIRYGFASHAGCISDVHERARQKCLFERVATAITAFRAKYGLGPTHDHEMRHCIRLYTGF